MNDISPILLESVQGYFDMWFYADKEVKEIYKKVRNGTATFKEMKRFSERAGDILVESLKVTFSADKLPDGKLYQNIAEKVITPMLEQNHELINEVCGYVADDLNKAARIGTKAVTAAFNADKAETVAQIAANCGEIVPGNKAAQLVENATMSMVDDFIQANLEFQKKLGLVPQIQRIYHGTGKHHCEFCASLQYTGEYKGPGMPAEIFRRHRDCRCTLIYKPQKGPYQDPWSKAEKDDYQKLVADQRKYLTELDKMSPGERRLERNARARAQRRSQYSPSEWADRKAQQRIIAENRANGKEYRIITQEKILQEKALQNEARIKKIGAIEKTKTGKLSKAIDVDDLSVVLHGKNNDKRIEKTIYDVIRKEEKKGNFFISEISALEAESDTILLSVVPVPAKGKAMLKLEVNTKILNGKTLEEINEKIRKTRSTVANNLEEAVIHECGHAKQITGKSISEIEELYKELANKGIDGISPRASVDGSEAISEIEILKYRGEKIPIEAELLYNEYIRSE